MAEETKIIYLRIDASKAVEGGREAQRALEAIEKSGEKVAASLAKMEEALDAGAIYAKLVAVAGAGKLLTDKLLEMYKTARDAAAAITDLSEQLGVSTTFVQASQYSAAQHTVSLEKLTQAYTKATQTIGQAAQGQKSAIEVLDHLGVKVLDAAGKLRSTESILQDSATAILKVEDPARRVALAIELFGKSGAQMIPMLADIASGASNMAVKAQAAGAMIETGVLDQMGKLKSQSEEASLKWNALVATLAAPIATDALEKFNTMLGTVISQLERGRASGQGFWATVLQDQRNQTAAERTAKGQSVPMWLRPQAEQDAYRLQELQKERDAQWNPDSRDFVQRQIDTLNRSTVLDRQASMASEDDWSRRFKLPVVDGGGPGKKNPPVVGGGGGQTPAQKYDELISKLGIARNAQSQMTAAARAGDQAFEEQKATLDAQNKLFEIFGVVLDKNNPKLKQARDLILDTARGKMAEAFNVGTTALEQQNIVLEAQIRLRNEPPEILAREIALIKVKQEAEKAGQALTADDIEKRRQAIELNVKLTAQQEELRKAQELWTAPLKSALESIQSTAADAFDRILETGNLSFQELGQTFMRIVRRMAAEFLALATIRPVMSVLVNAVSPSMAQSMGLGGGAGGIGGGSLGGGGLGSLFGGGGLGNTSMPSWLGGGSVSGFLNSPISFGGSLYSNAAVSPASAMAPNGATGAAMGGVTWGAGLGAVAGVGMGAYQLLSGNGSASSTIGGISSMVGALVSLIPGIGWIAGPLIALAGNLLPGLFGMDKPPVITDQTYAQLQYGGDGWFTTGGAWGPNANSTATEKGLSGLGKSISSVFGLLGGVKDPSKVWGLSAQNKTTSSKDWSYSSNSMFLVDPSGNQEMWRMNEENMADTGAAQVAYRSILGGATGDISEYMRTAITKTGQTMGGSSLQSIAETIAEILSFEEVIKNLGKTVTTAEAAIKQIDDSFVALYGTAEKYGLNTGEVDAAKAKARLGYATDFGKGLSREILQMTDPKAAALADLDDWKSGAIQNNQYLLDNVTGAMDQILKIEELYALKRAQIVEDGAKASLTSLVDVIARLTYGDLSGATPENVLSGSRGTYNAMLAKARAGDQSAIAGLGGAAANYAGAAKDYYAISPQYNAIAAGLTGDLASVAANNGGASLLADLPQAIGILGQVLAELKMELKNANDDNAALKAQLAEVTALFQRAVNS